MQYVVGLDWGSAEHAVCVLGEDGREAARFTASHTAEGLAELVEAPWDYFPEPGDSRQRNAALPDIWQQPDAWQQAIADYRQAVADLLAVTREGVDSPEQVAAPVAAVQQGCKGCHDGFRR